MTKSEREQLEKQLRNNGATPSNYDANKWMQGNNTYTFSGSNRMTDNTGTTYGYANSKGRIDNNSGK